MRGTMSETLGMEVTEIGDYYLKMRMPVDRRTVQPHQILHGGASVALAESVASLAGNILVQPEQYCVGLEINANHLRPVKHGWIEAKASPAHLGKTTQVWNIDIRDEHDKPVCISRMTLAVLNKS